MREALNKILQFSFMVAGVLGLWTTVVFMVARQVAC